MQQENSLFVAVLGEDVSTRRLKKIKENFELEGLKINVSTGHLGQIESCWDRGVEIVVHCGKELLNQKEIAGEPLGFLKREDPREVLLAKDEDIHFENFAKNWRLGTTSGSAAGLINHYFSNVEVVMRSESKDSDLIEVLGDEIDGLMVPQSTAIINGWKYLIKQKMNPMSITPSLGQGAWAIMGNPFQKKNELVYRKLNHPETTYALICERSFGQTIKDAGIQDPLFGLATVWGDRISFMGGWVSHNGDYVMRSEMDGKTVDAEKIGKKTAEHLLTKVNT